MTKRECGECRMCCKLIAVRELNKPQGQWCQHTQVGGAGGCGIFDQPERPKACHEFQCMWLQRSVEDGGLPDDMRPDRSHAVLAPTLDGLDVVVHLDRNRPDAHKTGPLRYWLGRIERAGIAVHVVVGDRRVYGYHPIKVVGRAP
jgi:hypothetical protein